MLGQVIHRERGDTIIEVLLAITIFSLLAVGAIAVMNQGTNSAQRALEITQVRQQIDAQAEALRYVHQNYIFSLGQDQNGSVDESLSSGWGDVREAAIASDNDGVTAFGVNGATSCNSIPVHAFILDARKASLSSILPLSLSDTELDASTLPPYAQVVYSPGEAGEVGAIQQSYGIWIEATRAEAVNQVSYINFHIRACWENPGSGAAMTLGTIVRLYDPSV